MRHANIVVMAVLLTVFWFGRHPALADATKAGHCRAIYNEVWELRAKGKDGEANRLHGRARHKGCLEPPISKTLCPVLDEQEMRRELEGDTGLAGVIRAQKRKYYCG